MTTSLGSSIVAFLCIFTKFINILVNDTLNYGYFRFTDVLLRVLMVVQQLLQENRHASKRDIYYMNALIFKGNSFSGIFILRKLKCVELELSFKFQFMLMHKCFRVLLMYCPLKIYKK